MTKDGDTLTFEMPIGETVTYVADGRVPMGTFIVLEPVRREYWRPVIAKGMDGVGFILPIMAAR